MKALVVVDYQNDFVDGALGFEGAEKLDNIIVKKISDCRENGGKIIFTLDTHGENYLETQEGKKLPVVHCVDRTEGHKLYGETAKCVRAEDIVIKKPAFGSVELAKILTENNFDEVELCGLVTDICVVSNAIIAKAALPEARIIVDSKACGSGNKQGHENALNVMRGVQIEVV